MVLAFAVLSVTRSRARTHHANPLSSSACQFRNGHVRRCSLKTDTTSPYQIQRVGTRKCSIRLAASDQMSSSQSSSARALIFDCDGVILESEDLHREAYNHAFRHFCVDYEWTPEYYDVLQNKVGGGKPKMRHHFGIYGWPHSTLGPAPEDDQAKQDALVDALQEYKTQVYKELVAVAPPRPGVLELMDEALEARDGKGTPLRVCICSASTKSACLFVLDKLVGTERMKRIDVVLAGDDVPRKKPDPLIYNTCLERLLDEGTHNLEPESCVVVEDSLIGLQAAKGAGMRCLITTTSSTENQDFSDADAVVKDLGGVKLEQLFPADPSLTLLSGV